MLSIEIDDTSLNQFETAFLQYPELALNAAAIALEDGLEWLKAQIPDDPTGPLDTGYPSPLRTDKQRRWWFAHLRESEFGDWQMDASRFSMGTELGDLNKPSDKGQDRQMRDSFDVKITETPYEVFGDLSTDLPWAPWVVGPEFPGESYGGVKMWQAAIHAYHHRWWRLEEIFKENADELNELMQDIYWEHIWTEWEKTILRG